MRSFKGQGNVAMTLVFTAIALIIGVLVFSEVFNALPTLSGTANTTATQIETTTFSAFNLAAVGLIVLAAAAILSYLFLFRRGA